MKKTAWVILFSGAKILVCRRSDKVSNKGCWNFPGGNLDDGETPIAAAYRELKEETGISDITLYPHSVTSKADKAFYYFWGNYPINVPLKLNKESDQYYWVDHVGLRHKDKIHRSIGEFLSHHNFRYNMNLQKVDDIYSILQIACSFNKEHVCASYSINGLVFMKWNTFRLAPFFTIITNFMSIYPATQIRVSQEKNKGDFIRRWNDYVNIRGLNSNLCIKETA